MKSLNITNYICFVAVFLFFAGCKKDEIEKEPEKVIQDIELKFATAFSDGGINLVGKMNKISENLIEYGFVVSKDSLFKKSKILHRIAPTGLIGEFNADVNFGLEKDSIYYCAAYTVVTPYTLKTSNVKSVKSNGDKIVIVNSVTPLKASIGDTLTITGKYFTGQNLGVKFGDRFSAMPVVSDTLIKCIVPPDVKTYNPAITLNNGAKAFPVTTAFSLYAPEITDITTLGTFRDTITVNGKYFNKLGAGTQLSFGNIQAVVVANMGTQLKAIVPDNIESSRTSIKVTSQFQATSSVNQFVIRRPEINIVPTGGKVNDAVTIQGKYLHPILSKNLLYFENTQATLTSGTSAQLITKIPNGPFPKRKATLVYKLLEYDITYSVDIKINDKWVMVSSQVPFSEYDHTGTFTINNISYVIARSKDFMDAKKYVWKFNPADYTWRKMEIPFQFNVAQLTATSSKAYLYINTDLNNFWEYDPTSNQWTNKASYMAGVRNFGSMFSANGDVYLGMGKLAGPFGNYTPDNSIYKYAVSSNSWQKVTDYPTDFGNGERMRPNVWVVNNTMYIGAGASNSGQNQFHSYNLATSIWTRLKDVPDVRSDAIGFTFENEIFLAAGNKFSGGSELDITKYDINTNTWARLPDLISSPQVSSRVERGYAFVNNGKVFFGGGNGSTNRYELYETDANEL